MTLAEPAPRPPADPTAGDPASWTLTGQCPFLASADGAWRGATAVREHRCAAVSPPAALAEEKQRRLCLTADHESCATFLAARAAADALPGRAAGLPRPVVRTTPVVLDHGRIAFGRPSVRADRSTAQVVLMLVLIVAFAAIVLARMSDPSRTSGEQSGSSGPAAAAASATASPVSTTTTEPSAAITPGASGSGAIDPSPAASGTGGAAASPSPGASGKRTYTVRSGDTLVGIAARFGTTTKVLVKLNGISNPAALHVGQVLILP